MGIPDRAALFSVRCTVDWIVAAGVVCRRLLPALVFRTSFRLLPELVPDNGKHSISHGPLLNMVYSRGIGICPMPFCLHYFIATLFNECRNQPSSVRLPIPSGMKRRSCTDETQHTLSTKFHWLFTTFILLLLLFNSFANHAGFLQKFAARESN